MLDLSNRFPTRMRRSVVGDCGSEEYVEIRITRDGEDAKSNFKSLLGKNFLDEDTGCLRPLIKSDKHLIGKRIKMRSACCCRWRSQYKVCLMCYGVLGLSMPPEANIGHLSAVAVCEIISQAVLSTKHLDGAASIEVLKLTNDHRRHFKLVGGEVKGLALRDNLVGKDIRLTVSSEYIRNLEDLSLISDINGLTISRMSEIHSVTIDRGDRAFTVVPTTIGKSPSCFSPEMLMFIKEHRWSLTADGDYQFNLTDLPRDVPILVLPRKHRNMLEFQSAVSDYVESSGEGVKRTAHKILAQHTNVHDALVDFISLVNTKVNVNVVHLEIFILSYMCRDPGNHDGTIPELHEPISFTGRKNIFKIRSAGPAMAYESQQNWIYDHHSYSPVGRPDHPYDRILLPVLTKR